MSGRGDNAAVAHARPTLLDRATAAAPLALPAAASIFIVVMCHSFLFGAQSRPGDEMFHQANEHAVAVSLDEGRNPLSVQPILNGMPSLRMYQVLQSLASGFVQHVTGLRTLIVHNWLLILLFASTPWTYRRFFQAIGMAPMATSLGSLLLLASAGGFTNSFHSYIELGVCTQAGASVLLPLALASMARLLRTGGNPIPAGVLLALTLLAHAAFAMYAAFGGLLLLIVFPPRRLTGLLRFAAAPALALLLSAGWLVPFVAMQGDEIPLPEMVTRPRRQIWFNGLDPDEMARILVTGRFFDGCKNDGSEDDEVWIRMNMLRTEVPRFPYLSILVGAGAVIALLRFRRRSSRMLLAGLSVSLLVILGQDDLPILARLPLLSKTQIFRFTWFAELFGIGLAGAAVHEGGLLAARLARKVMPQAGTRILTGSLLIVASAAHLSSVAFVVSPMIDEWDTDEFDAVVELLDRAGEPDPVKRVAMNLPGRNQFKKSLIFAIETRGGYHTTSNHWGSIFSGNALLQCGALRTWWVAPGMARLMGVRYLMGDGKKVAKLLAAKKHRGQYEKLGDWSRYTAIQDLKASMLHSVNGPRILVVANEARWYLLTRDWIQRFHRKVERPKIPWLVRAPEEALTSKQVLDGIDAVMYLGDAQRGQTAKALAAIAASGKPLYLGAPIPGVDGTVLSGDDPHWRIGVAKELSRQRARLEIEPASGTAPPHTFRFRVQSTGTSLAVLSMMHFDNWSATLDGKDTPVLSTGPDLVAAIIPPGSHDLVFTYNDSPLEDGTLIASLTGWGAVSLFGLLTLSMGIARRRKRKDPPGTGS